jgi:hypothetical protein
MALQSQFGAFVPTTDVYDIQTLYDFNPTSEEYKLFLVRLRQSVNNHALVLNIKDSGYYLPAEFINGQLYFPNPDPSITAPDKKNPVYRQVYRMLVNFGALPNTGTKSVAHTIVNVDSQYTFTRIYATASDTSGLTYIPIPTMTALGEIYMSADVTNVNITTTFNASNYNVCYAILEYIKE